MDYKGFFNKEGQELAGVLSNSGGFLRQQGSRYTPCQKPQRFMLAAGMIAMPGIRTLPGSPGLAMRKPVAASQSRSCGKPGSALRQMGTGQQES